jgi:hypothetical protein
MTAFSKGNFDFTQRAHLAAREQVYPLLWPKSTRLQFVDTTKAVKDLEYAVDCIAAVTVEGFRAPLKFFIQERWRKANYRNTYTDVTVTEWNTATHLPSELHKIAAHYLVYGFYDPNRDKIVDAFVVNVAQMLKGIADGRIAWTREQRPTFDQDFIAVELDELERNAALTLDGLHHSKTVETMTDYTERFNDDECYWELPPSGGQP